MTIVVTVAKTKTEISTTIMTKDPAAVRVWKNLKIGGCPKW